MLSQFKNPFSRIRAEQMGDFAWKYFVEPTKASIGERPLIFEGGRGTGKTMFFRCNSWKEKFAEASANKFSAEQFLSNNKHIGFYYKADGRFVKSMGGKKIESEIWIGIFNTYFNVVITKEIIAFIEFMLRERLIPIDPIKNAINEICIKLEEEEANNLAFFKSRLNVTIDKIEKFSNNTDRETPLGLNAGTIIEKLLLTLKEFEALKNITFHIFVDEYEVLNENQQVELNTLLKQSNSDIVYDFGVITKGILTLKTGSGQEIRPKDDFNFISTDRFNYLDKDEYNELLKKICQKRLNEVIPPSIATEDKYLEITYYLKNYGKPIQEQLFRTSQAISVIKEKVVNEVKTQSRIYNYTEKETHLYIDSLTNCSPILLRMHLALLMRKGGSIVNAKHLYEAKEKKTKEYKEWMHNTENAIVYLLCDELKVERKYHGFYVYSALSSGVIRSFLELAEYAFDYAFNDNQNTFNFDNPRPLTVEEQTRAVYFVSNFKIKEIDSYEPLGYKLKPFVKALGKIFNSIQTNPNNTLGEVEQNHFTTNVNDFNSLKSEAGVLLKYSIRHKILEEVEPTKTKSDSILEYVDLHLNHIYCPAFKISHLRKRKIFINHLQLEKLLIGTNKEVDDVVNKLSIISADNTPTLFSEQ